jgi:hypothetical protein
MLHPMAARSTSILMPAGKDVAAGGVTGPLSPEEAAQGVQTRDGVMFDA